MQEVDAKIWGSQVTVDYSLKVGPELMTRLLREILDLGHKALGMENDGDQRADGNKIKGLTRFMSACGEVSDKVEHTHRNSDAEIKCPSRDLFREIIARAIGYGKLHADIGGSPAISALAGMHLDAEGTFYQGNVPNHVATLLQERYEKFVSQFVQGNPRTEHLPGTLTIEDADGRYKVMISFSEGRELRDLNAGFYKGLREMGRRYKVPFLAVSGLNKGTPEEYSRLIETAREGNASMGIFVGTGAFNVTASPESYWRTTLSKANIASFNEEELAQTGIIFSRTDKLAGTLPFIAQKMAEAQGRNPIVACHSAAGAIMSYDGLPRDAAQHALEMAVAGASLRCAAGTYGSEAEIGDFRRTGKGKNYELFREIMGKGPEELPCGLVGVVAPDLSDHGINGSITGAGATFDGILLNYVAPLARR